jgi:hypothetical protein
MTEIFSGIDRKALKGSGSNVKCDISRTVRLWFSYSGTLPGIFKDKSLKKQFSLSTARGGGG